jgi:hypothetical protein
MVLSHVRCGHVVRKKCAQIVAWAGDCLMHSRAAKECPTLCKESVRLGGGERVEGQKQAASTLTSSTSCFGIQLTADTTVYAPSPWRICTLTLALSMLPLVCCWWASRCYWPSSLPSSLHCRTHVATFVLLLLYGRLRIAATCTQYMYHVVSIQIEE